MLRKIDLTPIIIKYLIGNTTDSTPKPIYSEPKKVYGKVIDKGGILVDMPYGNNMEYDKAIIFNASEDTRYINEKTAIFLEEQPTKVFPNGDYEVKRVDPIKLNTFTIYLEKAKGIKMPRLYYEKDNVILEKQFNFDSDTLIGYVPYNQYIPFDFDSKIWTRKVADASSTSGLIELISIENIDETRNHKLTFTKVV